MQMYEFVRGPLLWLSFFIFIGGMAVRIAMLINLSTRKDRVVYDHFSLSWALRSIFHWILPLNHTVRQVPVYSAVAYFFHICLLIVPVFLLGHGVIWFESWGISLWGLPETLTDYLTLLVIAAILFMTIRRMAVPHVRVVTSPMDYVLLMLISLPFLTGYIAHQQWFHYKLMLILHILSGELLLVIIPFTKLAHMILFFFTRAHIGMEFGQRRGTVTW
jgi:nitrate reductase gamma subunit